jgi:hypothetical protein
VIIDKGKEKKWTEMPQTDRISVAATEQVLKFSKTAEREDSGDYGSERSLDRNHL